MPQLTTLHSLHSQPTSGKVGRQGSPISCLPTARPKRSCLVGTTPALLAGSEDLRARILAMAHESHLRIVRLKQRCRDVAWWPGTDREIETLVKDSTACLLSGKTRATAPTPPMQSMGWTSQRWEHLQLDIYGELHGVPHHQ